MRKNRSRLFLCSCGRLRHEEFNSQDNHFYEAFRFATPSSACCSVTLLPVWQDGHRRGHGPAVARELWYSETANAFCKRWWWCVCSTCSLLPVYLVGPAKQWVHTSKENLHKPDQSLSSVSWNVAYLVQCTELALGNLFHWVQIEKNPTGLTVAPQNWSLRVLSCDRGSCPLVCLCFFCPLNSAWPFLCSTVRQTRSGHAITPVFLPNTFLLWQISVQSTEEPWACSLLPCSLFWWFSGWYLSLVQHEEWAQSVNV